MSPKRLIRSSAAAAVAIAVVLGACTRSPDVARHTVDDYRANDELRRGQLAQCANDPGTLGDTPDCINARQAERLQGRRSLRDLPPVQLPKPSTDSSGGAIPAAPSTGETEVEAPREASR